MKSNQKDLTTLTEDTDTYRKCPIITIPFKHPLPGKHRCGGNNRHPTPVVQEKPIKWQRVSEDQTAFP